MYIDENITILHNKVLQGEWFYERICRKIIDC